MDDLEKLLESHRKEQQCKKMVQKLYSDLGIESHINVIKTGFSYPLQDVLEETRVSGLTEEFR